MERSALVTYRCNCENAGIEARKSNNDLKSSLRLRLWSRLSLVNALFLKSDSKCGKENSAPISDALRFACKVTFLLLLLLRKREGEYLQEFLARLLYLLLFLPIVLPVFVSSLLPRLMQTLLLSLFFCPLMSRSFFIFPFICVIILLQKLVNKAKTKWNCGLNSRARTQKLTQALSKLRFQDD